MRSNRTWFPYLGQELPPAHEQGMRCPTLPHHAMGRSLTHSIGATAEDQNHPTVLRPRAAFWPPAAASPAAAVARNSWVGVAPPLTVLTFRVRTDLYRDLHWTPKRPEAGPAPATALNRTAKVGQFRWNHRHWRSPSPTQASDGDPPGPGGHRGQAEAAVPCGQGPAQALAHQEPGLAPLTGGSRLRTRAGSHPPRRSPQR